MTIEKRTYTKDGDKILVSHDPQRGEVGGICRDPLPADFFNSPADLWDDIPALAEAGKRAVNFKEFEKPAQEKLIDKTPDTP